MKIVLLIILYFPIYFINAQVANIKNIRWGSTNNTLDGVNIIWQSYGNTDKIKWGYSNAFEVAETFANSRPNYYGNLFEYNFPVLQANDTVFYSLYDSQNLAWTATKKFAISSDTSSNHFIFSVTGDTQKYPGEALSGDTWQWHEISEAIEPADFHLNMGDINDYGDIPQEWEWYFDYGANFLEHNIVYRTIGNHEVYSTNPSHQDTSISFYHNQFTLPNNNPDKTERYYSHEQGNTIFICLNSEDLGNTKQYNWFVSQLEQYRLKMWKVVYFHRPLVGCRAMDSYVVPYVRKYWKLFDDYTVDLIINGHLHGYTRTLPINMNVDSVLPVAEYGSARDQGRCEVIAASGGARLYHGCYPETFLWSAKGVNDYHYLMIEIKDDSLIYQAKNKYRSTFDSFKLKQSIVNHIIPIDSQWIANSVNGNQLNVSENMPASSRMWKYGTISGVYDQSTGITDETYTPYFSTDGVYYVVCESNLDGKIYHSNEVVVEVSTVLAYSELKDYIRVETYQKHGNIYVNVLDDLHTGSVELFHVHGRTLAKNRLHSGLNELSVMNDGAYFARIVLNNRVINKKFIVHP